MNTTTVYAQNTNGRWEQANPIHDYNDKSIVVIERPNGDKVFDFDGCKMATTDELSAFFRHLGIQIGRKRSNRVYPSIPTPKN
jgi:hypothetical protein